MRISSLFNNSKSGLVILNVYDLNEANDSMYQFGLGMYHSGVELNGREYTFGSQGGIFSHEPRNVPTAKFREAITIAPFTGTSRDVDRIIEELRASFGGSDYNILTKNCNSFAEAFIWRLCQKPIPGYVNRMATFGSYISCLLPPSITGDAPVDSGSSFPAPGPTRMSSQANPASSFSGKGHRLTDS